MTLRQIALVQESWKKLQPLADAAAELLYARLFALDPSLKVLFKGDMRDQGRKVIVSAVQALGRRHAGYGVEERHYAVVESALVWTLEQGLGAGFTREVEDAWRTAYGVLATTMKQAANNREEDHATESTA
jgi:hemoglobin-like flavoprotein